MGLRTILVEDSPLIRENLIPSMEDMAGAQVIGVAETESDAVKLLASLDWQLVVVDLFLKEGTGLGVLHAVQHRRPEQHAFVLTNFPNPQVVKRCFALGAEEVFDKSTELDSFFERCLALA